MSWAGEYLPSELEEEAAEEARGGSSWAEPEVREAPTGGPDRIALASQASQAERLMQTLEPDGGQAYDLARRLSGLLKRRLKMHQMAHGGIRRREADKGQPAGIVARCTKDPRCVLVAGHTTRCAMALR